MTAQVAATLPADPTPHRRIVSPVVYYGGKSAIAPWIVAHFPEHRVYVELFCGGASVLFAKPRAEVEVINDINGEVVNFFTMARDRGDDLVKALFLTPYARAEFEAVMNAPQTDDPIERARRFLVLSRQSFNGCAGSRKEVNQNHWKCASIGVRKNSSQYWKTVIDKRIYEVIDRLQGVSIDNADFGKLITHYDTPETVFYADPPYLRSSRSAFGKHGYLFDFNDSDMARLWKALANIKGHALVSHYDCPQIREMAAGWNVAAKSAQKGYQGPGGREAVTELLFSNQGKEMTR